MHKKVINKRKILQPIFHQQTKDDNNSQLSSAQIKTTRKTGKLNLSGRSLNMIPDKLWKIYEPDHEKYLNCELDESPEQKWWDYAALTNLDLSSNCLTEIPSCIKMFNDLQVLNLCDNLLVKLPNEVGEFEKLTKLNISHNKLTVVPEGVHKLTNLNILLMSYNNIEKIEEGLCDLVMLKELDLSHNNITELPPGLGYLIRLTQLNLSFNKLIKLPPDIVNLRILLKLDLTNNELTELAPLGELRKLEILYAHHNNITKIPNCEGCERLQEIYLGNNFIDEISEEFCEVMSHLKCLDLRDNKIEKIPDEISRIIELTRLDVSNNALTNLPLTLGQLNHLQTLRVEGNMIRSVRRDIVQCGTARILKFLREKNQMEPSNKEIIGKSSTTETLENFPDKYAMKNSRSLNISSKNFTAIPAEVFDNAKEAGIKIVDLSRNKLIQVPEELKKLSENIIELNISVNLFSEIPDFISNFERLQYINLSGNSIKTLPNTFGKLKNLRELCISNNKFENIPCCVYEMESLEILLASDNGITSIDVDKLLNLKKLATLDLSNNNINNVPPELGNMNLKTLLITGNSFRVPGYAILVKGTDAILSHLRDRIPK